MNLELSNAMALHRAGRVAEAEAIYRRGVGGGPPGAEAVHVFVRSGWVGGGGGGGGGGGLRLGARARGGEGTVAERPEEPDALHLLGLAACQGGRLEEAVELILRAVERVPGNGEFLTNLGEVQRRLGRFADAIATFQGAIGLAPESPTAHYNLAV